MLSFVWVEGCGGALHSTWLVGRGASWDCLHAREWNTKRDHLAGLDSTAAGRDPAHVAVVRASCASLCLSTQPPPLDRCGHSRLLHKCVRRCTLTHTAVRQKPARTSDSKQPIGSPQLSPCQQQQPPPGPCTPAVMLPLLALTFLAAVAGCLASCTDVGAC